MKLQEIVSVLQAEVISGTSKLGMEVRVGCASDLMSDVLAFAVTGNILLTGLTNPQVVRAAEMAEIKAICFVRGKKPDKKTIDLAEDRNILLLATHLPMFESCGRLYEQGLKGLGYLSMDKNNAQK
jgi:predicted transcriptional regulator